MLDLTEFRRRMSGYVRGDLPAGSVPGLAEPAASGRLAVYRNNAVLAASSALASNHAGTVAFLGEECFAALARDYVRAHPPTDRSLVGYGTYFSSFLEAHPAMRSAPYLGDAARLDRAWLEVHLAADSKPADAAGLAQWLDSGGDIATARFDTIPALRLCALAWGIAEIWMSVRGGAQVSGSITVTGRDDHVLIWRPGQEVLYRRLKACEHAFILALNERRTLAEAADAALTVDPSTDISQVLASVLDAGLVQPARQ